MTIKSITFVLLMLLLTPNIFAQENQFKAPDYNWIKEEIQKKDSKYNYKTQLERFKANDTTFTAEEYRNLYFGYFFQKEYSAFSGADDTHDKLVKYYQSEKIDKSDYPKIIKLSNKALQDDPFDLRVMNFLAYVYHLDGNDDMAKKLSIKFQNIITTILATGDGKTCETGFHVLSVSHEYVLLNVLELQSVSQSLVSNCDYQAFEKGKYKIDGIYFSIGKILENEMASFGGK